MAGGPYALQEGNPGPSGVSQMSFDTPSPPREGSKTTAEETSDSSPDRPEKRDILLRDNSRLRADLSQLRAQAARALGSGNDGPEKPLMDNSSKILEVTKENLLLRAELRQMKEAASKRGDSEGRLRTVMLSQTATTEQLRHAIGAVQSLLDEARRELKQKETRELRAAYEELDAATQAGDEHRLIEALAVARRSGVDESELKSAERKLQEVTSLTDEQREAKASKAVDAALKLEAFRHIKRNEGDALSALLDNVKDGRWKEWKDSNGKSLWRSAQALNVQDVKAVLAARLGSHSNSKPGVLGPASTPAAGDRTQEAPPPSTRSNALDAITRFRRSNTTPCTLPAEPKIQTIEFELPSLRETEERFRRSNTTPCTLPAEPKIQTLEFELPSPREAEKRELGDKTPCTPQAPKVPAGPRITLLDLNSPPAEPNGSQVGSPTPSSPRSGAHLSPTAPGEHTEEGKLKARALKAIAQDNSEDLQEILAQIPITLVRDWKNKAGTDLLTLAEERKKGKSYSVLAKAMGLVKEEKPERYEEKDSVWVFLPGEVAAVRATVVEEAAEEAQTVLLEFWEGNAPARHVNRRRIWRSEA